jgi:uncharacterized protein with HEPN domain
MTERLPSLRVNDMLQSIRGIEKAIAGKSYRDYERSWLLRSAEERGIEVISDASARRRRRSFDAVCVPCTWLSGQTPPRGNWKLYVDRVIAV